MIKFGLYGLAIIVLFYLTGFLNYHLNTLDNTRKLRVAILQENIDSETRWDESNGDRLANDLFDLNRKATAYKPDLIVWSESAVPWTYRPNDDLINKALDITRETNAEHIIGVNTESETDSEKILNSAYLINASGSVVSRHDKVNLLSFLETSFMNTNLKIPFFSESIYSNIIEGSSLVPLKAEFANLGVLICNESLTPYETQEMVRKGAELIIILSNDAWGENTHLIDWHFYVTRFRAVESGKDIIVNSNRGIGGIIEGNGNIIIQNQSTKAECITGKVGLRKTSSFYNKLGDWFVYLGMIVLIISVLKKIY